MVLLAAGLLVMDAVGGLVGTSLLPKRVAAGILAGELHVARPVVRTDGGR